MNLRQAALAGTVWLLGVGAAAAEGTVLMLDTFTQANARNFEAAGFEARNLNCASGDSACLQTALAAPDLTAPVYLIAAARHTGTVRTALATGLSSADVATVFLLRAEPGFEPFAAAADPPSLIVLTEVEDPAERVQASRAAAETFHRSGLPAHLMFADTGQLSSVTLGRQVLDLVLHYMGKSPYAETMANLLDAYARWFAPPIDNAAFYEDPSLVASFPMRERLMMFINLHYEREPHLSKQWPMRTYQAFDLMAYRDKVAPGARYVTLRNFRNQVLYLDLEEYGPYQPVIVVGIDDRPNMYRFAWFYRTKAMYSWKPDIPDISVRLLGPTLFFNSEDMPVEKELPLLLRSAIVKDGITFSDDDPLAFIAAYPDTVQRIITEENKCVYCHTIDGRGGYTFHVRARDTEPQGGYGLPLTAYPDEVLNGFIYDQVNTAAKIGMTPNPLPEDVRQIFYDWVKTLPPEPPGPE